MADLKQQLGGVVCQSQMFIVDEEILIEDGCSVDEIGQGQKSAQPSIYSAGGFTSPSTTVRTNLNSRHRSDLKHLEKERKDNYEVMYNRAQIAL